MADSPSHKFGQIVGDLLEEIMTPILEEFCTARGLYLDKKGVRGTARGGKRVSWLCKFGNSHDLDFVIEKDGTADKLGRPVAFIEAAWRRYTKHSRNKAQEIQGAILPIAEKHSWDKPFLGAILAGVFTEGSLTQMRSSGFEIVLFPYETIVDAFGSVGIDARFDEDTSDRTFEKTITEIQQLPRDKWEALKRHLVAANRRILDKFFTGLRKTLDRRLEQVLCVPLHGKEVQFDSAAAAISFVDAYDESVNAAGGFQKYEVIAKYSNGDQIDASFAEKKEAIRFLKYIAGE